MTQWDELLEADPTPWLLEPDAENTGVRYRTLRELCGLPEDAPDVRAAREAVMTTGPVPVILTAQQPEGYWVKPGSGYGPKYTGTVWQIIFLAELGADPADARVRQGCGYLLDHGRAVNGAFAVSDPPVPSSVIPCLNGNLLHALLRLGFGHDERVGAALDWLVRAVTGEGIAYLKSGTSGPCFACAANLGQPCAWGAAKVMRGLLTVPPDQRSPMVDRAIAIGEEFLLSRDPALAEYPHTERVSSTWFKLGFPLSYWSDVLEIAGLLVDLGHGSDPRVQGALRFIRDKADSQARWKLENSLNGKMWADIEQKGKPSKWVTLRACAVLKRAAAQE
jgi:hypothetical protein